MNVRPLLALLLILAASLYGVRVAGNSYHARLRAEGHRQACEHPEAFGPAGPAFPCNSTEWDKD